MNDINFIKPIPPKKQQSLNRWFTFTAYSSLLLLAGLLLVTSCQIFKFVRTKRKHQRMHQTIQSFESDVAALHKRQEQKNRLSKRLEKATAFKNNPKLPTIYLQELARIIPADVALTAYKQESNTHIELEGNGMQTNTIIAFANALNASSLFENMHLASLQHQKNDTVAPLHFVIKGTISKKS